MTAVTMSVDDTIATAVSATGRIRRKENAARATHFGGGTAMLIGAFYYVRYGGARTKWQAWRSINAAATFDAPREIASDFTPLIGPYDSRDPAVIDQHLAWAQEAGINVFVVSRLRRDEFEHQSILALMERAARTDIKICFVIGAYAGRTLQTVADDIDTIYERYSRSKAFLWIKERTLYCRDPASRGLFLLWAAHVQDVQFFPRMSGRPVPPDHWVDLVDAMHRGPRQSVLVANPPLVYPRVRALIDDSHFDGLFNYTHQTADKFASWAPLLPDGATYVPCVLPGYSAVRIGYASSTFVPRCSGATYNAQWAAALAAGPRPLMVVVTSFNEWNEGTQIEPAVSTTGEPPDLYLRLTRAWADWAGPNGRRWTADATPAAETRQEA